MDKLRKGGSRFVEVARKVTVEPLAFLLMFSYGGRLTSLQSMFHDRACRISLNYPDEICSDLENAENDDAQLRAVTYGNNLYNGYMMAATLPALVVAIFIGPWSDKYSRKFPMVLATVGSTADCAIQAVITNFPNSSPVWFIGSAVISGVTGGVLIIQSSTFSYMSDITDERSRQTRFAILEFATMLAAPIGSFVEGQVFKAGGYLPVMIIGAVGMGLATVWTIVFIPETKKLPPNTTIKQMARDLFKLDNIKDSYRTCAQPRPGNLRKQIWLLIIVTCSVRFITIGYLGIGFAYTRKMYKWDIPQYANTNTVFSLIHATVTLTVIPLLSKKLLLHEAAVGLIGTFSLMSKMILMSVNVHEYFVYYSLLAGSLYACCTIAVKSRLSKVVSRQELGRVFSLLATCESLTPVLGTLAMIQIYNETVSFYPGLVFVLATVFLIPSACIFGWMMRMPTMSFTEYQESEATVRNYIRELESLPSTRSTEKSQPTGLPEHDELY